MTLNRICRNSGGVLLLAAMLAIIATPAPLVAQAEWKININRVPYAWKGPYTDNVQGRTWQSVFGRSEGGTVTSEGRLNASLAGPLGREEMRDMLLKKAEYESVHGSQGKWSPPQDITLNQSAFTGFIITAGPNFGFRRDDYAGVNEATFGQFGYCYLSNGKVGVEISLSALASARGNNFTNDMVKGDGQKFWSAVYDLLKGVTVTGGGTGPETSVPTPQVPAAPAMPTGGGSETDVLGTWNGNANGYPGLLTFVSQIGGVVTGTFGTLKIENGRVVGNTITFTVINGGTRQVYKGTIAVTNGVLTIIGTFLQDNVVSYPWSATKAGGAPLSPTAPLPPTDGQPARNSLAGHWVFDMEYLGQVYAHDMFITSDTAEGVMAANGGYPAGKPHSNAWVAVAGAHRGEDIKLTLKYTAGPAGTMQALGRVLPDGSMTGTWTDDVGGTRRGTWKARKVK